MLKVVELPKRDLSDVAATLRRMADNIEAGTYGDVAVAWVMDSGARDVEVGLIGQAPEPKAATHLLFARAQRALEA